MAKFSWKNPPSTTVVSGSEDFLRDREVQTAIRDARFSGRRHVDLGEDPDLIEDQVTASETFGEPLLLVIRFGDGKKFPTETLIKTPNAAVRLLIILDGDEAPSWVESERIPRVSFARPKSRNDRKEAAIRFATTEARMAGTPFEKDSLVDAFIDVVGEDLGIVSMEISKASAHARGTGRAMIGLETIQGTARRSAGMDLSAVTEALARRDAAALAKSLSRIKLASSSDPAMLLLRAKGGPVSEALAWMKLAALMRTGASEEEAATRSGIPVWAAKKVAIPAARNWRLKGLRRLIAALGRVDRGILSGTISDPWLAVEAALLDSCSAELGAP